MSDASIWHTPTFLLLDKLNWNEEKEKKVIFSILAEFSPKTWQIQG